MPRRHSRTKTPLTSDNPLYAIRTRHLRKTRTTFVSLTMVAMLACAMMTSVKAFQPPAAAAPGPKIIYSRLAGFGIPYRISNDDGTFVEVQLYSSENQGGDWEFLARQPTNGTEFPFQAKREGEYWFALKTLDRNRRLLPEGKVQPELKIIVDTTLPEMQLAVQTDAAGRIVCRWEAFDRYLDVGSLKLQYRQTSGSMADLQSEQWMDVPVNPPQFVPNGIYADQIAFWPDTDANDLEVRISIADQAGNPATARRQVRVQRPAWRHSTRATARPTDTAARSPSTATDQPQAGRSQSIASNGGNNSGGDDASDASVWRQAFYSRLRQQEADAKQQLASQRSAFDGNQPDQRATTPASPSGFQSSGFQPSGFRSHSDSHGSASLNRFQRKPPVQPMAPPPASRQATLIGSTPEYAAPPVPEGWTLADEQDARRKVTPDPQNSWGASSPGNSFPTPNPNSGSYRNEPFPNDQFPSERFPSEPSPYAKPRPRATLPDVWESNVQSNGIDTHTSSSTTNQPDRSMLPIATMPYRKPGPADAVAANPHQTKVENGQFTGRSSTNWPQNQYRGPDGRQMTAKPDAQFTSGSPSNGLPPEIFRPLDRSASTTNGTSPGSTSTFAPANSASSASPASSAFRSASSPRSMPDAPTSRQENRGRPSANGPTKSNTQIISTRRFNLNYDINAIDPSGVGKVDLWMTTDQGRTWNLWGVDPDNRSPMPVEVEAEGLYGFRVVIHSREGLAGVGPSSGDDADMWIRVDTQSPLAQITSVPYGRGDEAGRLVIHYRVADDFLTLRPVRLSYSRSPQGPFTIIEDALRNDGRYLWKVDRAVPDRIFLKLDAVDRAGNVGTFTLPQSIDVSGLVPRGTIHSVEPVGVK